MRIAYLECFSGISGDMFLGALVDAGVPPELFTRTVKALGVDARLEISRVDRSGISATKVDVIAAGEKELPREECAASAGHSHADHSHGEHSHSDHEHKKEEHRHDHGHSHDHTHSHEHAQHHSHRGLKEIRQIINQADFLQPPMRVMLRMLVAVRVV